MRKNNFNKIQISKILIFSPNWSGDTIMSTPMVCSLRKAFPAAFIVMIAKPYVYPLWKANPFIDEAWVFNAPRIYSIFAYLKLLRKIKEINFDLAIILPHYFRYALISFLAGIRIRIGYNVEQRGIFLTHALDYNSSLREKHMVENYLDILRAIGVEPERKELVLNIDSKTQIKVEEIMQKKGIMLEDLVIGIAPGAIYGEAKRWPKERFIELADTLIEKYNAKILIFTGPMEKELGYEIKKMMKNSPLTFNGDNPLLETAALIKRCNLFITNDSGLMHVAAAVKTKIIAIFGSTSPEWTKPYGDGHIIIRKTIDCSPCFKRKCRYRTYDCLNSITVSDILEVIDIYKRENINKSLLKNYNRKHLFFYKTLKRCY